MEPEQSGRKNRWRKFIFLACLILVVWVFWKVVVRTGLGLGTLPPVSASEWQAVFLANNQVYFGHLNYARSYVVLKDVFYLRVGEPLQQGSPPQPTLSLVRLGGEIHGPQDTMYIPQDKILFWENMKKDAQVVQAINAYLSKK